MAYDFQIRKRVADQMNQGVDIEKALTDARSDQELRMVHFINPVAISINSPECRACSAPGLCDRVKAHSQLQDAPRPPSGSQPSGAQPSVKAAAAKAKKLRKKAREAELKQLGRAALDNSGPGKRKLQALQNGGVGGSTRPPPPANPAKRQKGSGKGKLKDKTDNDESICFNWNKGKPCTSNPCRHKHVCRI